MSWYRTAFGAHYRWLYAHRNAEEAAACVAAVAPLLPLADGPVLDLGCGGGRHFAPLAARGATGLGVDLSPHLLEVAAAAPGADALPPVRADMRQLPLRDHACVAVLSLFTTFGYFGDLAAQLPVIDEIARILRPGGRWCLDYLNARRVRAELAVEPPERTRREGPCEVREKRRLAAAGDRVLKRVRIYPAPGHVHEAAAAGVPEGGLDYTESVALFEPEELDAVADARALRRVAALGGYDGRPFDPDAAERWILVYEREVA